MVKRRIWILMHGALAVFSVLALSELAAAGTVPSKPESKKLDIGVHEFTVADINGKSQDLKTYKGKVLLIVNTASQCGYTPQYKGLQRVYTTYKNKGFEVLGFPSNDFGGQEPGSNKEIKNFCELNYKVSFPMFTKVTVLGPGQSPLFKYLTADASKELAGPIDWNFEKFLIDPQGKLIGRFKSSVAPESPELISKIESLLTTKK
jgi:glutathione peroxidase